MSSNFHVDAEVGTLHEVLMCQPGIELHLGSVMDEKKALRLGNVDLTVMREQWATLAKLYTSLGITVVDYKEVLSEGLPGAGISAEVFVAQTLKRFPKADRSTIEAILHEDAKKYTEKKAVTMNQMMVGDATKGEEPLVNAIFTCDPGMLVGPTCILSRMRDSIRQREVEVYKYVMRLLGHDDFFRVKKGVFEGGDGMVMNDTFYCGTGSRSTKKGAHQIAEYLHARYGMESFRIIIPDAKDIPEYRAFLEAQGEDPHYAGNMRLMHWDTIGTEAKRGVVYGCEIIMKYCQVLNVRTGFKENLVSHINRWGEVRDIPLEEQQILATNGVVVGVQGVDQRYKGTIVGTNPHAKVTTQMLRKDFRKREVYPIEFSEVEKFGGRVHCATGQLVKVSPWMLSRYAANRAPAGHAHAASQ